MDALDLMLEAEALGLYELPPLGLDGRFYEGGTPLPGALKAGLGMLTTLPPRRSKKAARIKRERAK